MQTLAQQSPRLRQPTSQKQAPPAGPDLFQPHMALVQQVEPEVLVWVQPVAELQESAVQASESLQSREMVPAVQTPAAHLSPEVHMLPSLQETVLLANTQPVEELQESVVQMLSSEQERPPDPTQDPPEQTSPVVQALLSLQVLELGVNTQPETVLQVSVVQGLRSLQVVGLPAVHRPPAQTSPVVQALPSLQFRVLLLWAQPLTGLQESVVHTLLSSQVITGPPVQVPLTQESAVVQTLASSQEPERLA